MARHPPSSRRKTSPFPVNSIVFIDRPAIWHGSTQWSWSVIIPQRYFNLWVLLAGAVTLTLRGRAYTRSQPSYFLLPPGERLEAVNAGPGPMANFTLHIGRNGLDPAWARRAVEGTWGAPVRRFEDFVQTARACVDAGLRDEPGHQAFATALAHALLLRFWADVTTPFDPPQRERIFDLAGRIRQRPEAVWRIAALAADCGYSRSRFTRLFADAIGLPPRDYITRCRMERARTLLAESSMNISEIAYAVGYHDVYFFSRHFKQVVGQAPRTYRKSEPGTPTTPPATQRQQG